MIIGIIILMLMMMIVMLDSLEGEVESQRQQRLSDAKQVEAKAARIKVTVLNHLHHDS